MNNEDIKVLEEYLDKQDRKFVSKYRLAFLQALENILKERQEDKERIKELEEERTQFYEGKLYTAKQLKNIEKDRNKYFINKQVVREKIEEKLEYIGKLYAEDEIDSEYYSEIKELLEDILQSLLEEGDK